MKACRKCRRYKENGLPRKVVGNSVQMFSSDDELLRREKTIDVIFK